MGGGAGFEATATGCLAMGAAGGATTREVVFSECTTAAVVAGVSLSGQPQEPVHSFGQRLCRRLKAQTTVITLKVQLLTHEPSRVQLAPVGADPMLASHLECMNVAQCSANAYNDKHIVGVHCAALYHDTVYVSLEEKCTQHFNWVVQCFIHHPI